MFCQNRKHFAVMAMSTNRSLYKCKLQKLDTGLLSAPSVYPNHPPEPPSSHRFIKVVAAGLYDTGLVSLSSSLLLANFCVSYLEPLQPFSVKFLANLFASLPRPCSSSPWSLFPNSSDIHTCRCVWGLLLPDLKDTGLLAAV